MTTALVLAMSVAGGDDCFFYGSYEPGVVYSYGAPVSGYVSSGYGLPYSGYGSMWTYAAPPAYLPMSTYRNGNGYRTTVMRPDFAASPAPRIVNMTERGGFEPARITINAGDTVEWRNASQHTHTVTADPDRARNPAHVVLPDGAQPFDSGEIPPGQRCSYTFETPGIYFYVCLPHEEKGMLGIVVVKDEGGRGVSAHDQGAPPPAPPGAASGTSSRTYRGY